MTQVETKSIEAPYDLPLKHYQLWQAVGSRLGFVAQAVVFEALRTNNHKIYENTLITGTSAVIQKLAKEADVEFTFI